MITRGSFFGSLLIKNQLNIKNYKNMNTKFNVEGKDVTVGVVEETIEEGVKLLNICQFEEGKVIKRLNQVPLPAIDDNVKIKFIPEENKIGIAFRDNQERYSIELFYLRIVDNEVILGSELIETPLFTLDGEIDGVDAFQLTTKYQKYFDIPFSSLFGAFKDVDGVFDIM